MPDGTVLPSTAAPVPDGDARLSPGRFRARRNGGLRRRAAWRRPDCGAGERRTERDAGTRDSIPNKGTV